jgi:superfamily I DNA and RNA helicase
MNERIRQLAEQATTIVDMVGPQGYASSYANFDREKFAELIVQQVIAIVEDQKNYNSIIYTTHDRDQARGIVKELVKSINQQLG